MTEAWTRKEGKNPEGGLNAKGRSSYSKGTLKAPVKGSPRSLEDLRRKASFLSRMSGNDGPERKPDGSPTRLLLSLKAWGASSKADAKSKAKTLLARYKSRKGDES